MVIALQLFVKGLIDQFEDRFFSEAGVLQFKIFSCLWAVATLFHLAHSNLFTLQFHYVLLSLAAVYVIFKPSLAGLLLLVSLQLVDVFYTMPSTSNHWLFTAFVNITIIQALVLLIVKNRSFTVKEDQLYKTFAPVVRIELIILYFYAVFHKLNSGFFTPASSCATELLKAQHLDVFSALPPHLFVANAYFTLLVESMIPVFLCFRKTRNCGVLIGLLFHCVLSYSAYNAFFDFSSMVFAAYFLFISPSFSIFLVNMFRQVKSGVSKLVSQQFTFKKLVWLLCFWSIGIAAIFLITKKLPKAYSYYLLVFWTAYSLLYICSFVWYMRFKPISYYEKATSFSFALPYKSLLILPVVVFLNGLCPYLGLKTENSYAMFSNLRTEGNISNHYIIPASFQIFDFQKDMVEIISSSDPMLQRVAEENKLMVFFDFKNYVAQARPDQVVYIRNGHPHTFSLKEARPDDELLAKNSVLKKVLNFRNISKSGPQPCTH